MRTLHDYVAKQLADKLKSRRVVVWYDERGEFQPFVDELRGGRRSASAPVTVAVAGETASLAEYAGSLFEVRAAVEPLVSGDEPDAVVVYIPGLAHDAKASVLMELEKAGRTWKPELKQLAKNVLLQKYTLGVVDELLPFDRKASYEDLARAAAGDSGAEPPSILKRIFHDAGGNDGLLTAWLVSDARDAEIVSKEATRELVKLVRARLGIALGADSPLSKLRAITLRYVLAGEFRLDLSCEPPAALAGVPKPTTKDEEAAVRGIARRLRTSFPDAYAPLADHVERELGLANAQLAPGALGAIDTFRFEERALLRHTGELLAAGEFDEALAVVTAREQSFWLDRSVARKAQWEAARRMAELGDVAGAVRAAVEKAGSTPERWIEDYTAKDGWHRLDGAQRRLEAWLTTLEEEPDERALGVVRRSYEDACQAMATGFTKVLERARWSAGPTFHQSHVFSDVVSGQPRPVAYFLVDAMRFEMGVELGERLPKQAEVSLRPAVCALPSITPVGMAALQPGAAASFSVVEQGGKLGARIGDAFLPDRAARSKFAAARVPRLVDFRLEELLSLPPSKLGKKLEGAEVIVVRSQGIDEAGETGDPYTARRIMDTVIDNLARAVRRLANAGVEYSVVSADHGHLFASDRDESMRIDAPGGDTVELHRRCWIGRGGTTPPGCMRVTAVELGYDSDLDFVFPSGCGVFKCGGDLAFHHGGPSLQELIVPVLTVRLRGRESARPTAGPLTAAGLPDAVTNRIFSVTFSFTEQLALGSGSVGGLVLRPLLVAGGRQVGSVGMAVDADFDRSTGCVTLKAGKPVTVAFLLTDETVPSLRVVAQDPATDAELYRSPTDIAVRLGV